MYDFSKFVDLDVEANGLFAAYQQLENYWKDETHRFPYIIQKEEKHVGFVLIRFIESEQQNYFSVAEFFVMKKYRREGIGKEIAIQIFDLHKGQWEVFQKESNKPAQLLWNKVIGEYNKVSFTERFKDARWVQDFISK